MLQWLYDCFMLYIMPIIIELCDLFGINMKKVHFEDAQNGGASDSPSVANMANAPNASGPPVLLDE